MKIFTVLYNVWKSKYNISYHDWVKKHGDWSDFYDIITFTNKKDFDKKQKDLLNQWYILK